MNWLKDRFKEPSTWKALFTVLGLSGYWIKPEMLQYIATAWALIWAVIDFIRKEKSHEKAAAPADAS